MDITGLLNYYKNELREKGEVYLRIKVHPNASKTEIKNIMDDETIKIDIAAPPVKNKANTELIKFLAGEFCVFKNGVKIISGASDKIKLIKIIR